MSKKIKKIDVGNVQKSINPDSINDITLNNIQRILNELKIKRFKLEDDGRLVVFTTSKKKLNQISERFDRPFKEEKKGQYFYQLQYVIDIEKLIDKLKGMDIDVSANKNIMYISGKGASKEVAQKIAKKYGGEYTEHRNPFLNKGFYRINFYGEKGLFLFNPLKVQKLGNKV